MAAAASRGSRILVYAGEGADPFCRMTMETEVKRLVDDRVYQVSQFTSLQPDEELGKDPSSIKAVILPGGNAAMIMFKAAFPHKSVEMSREKLEINSVACGQKIKKLFAQYKIACYTDCAGSIAICERFRQLPIPTQVCPSGELSSLSLFPGLAVAPLFPKKTFGKVTVEDVHVRKIRIIKTGTSFSCVHILSPGFINAEREKGAEVLSRHEDLGPIEDLVTTPYGSDERITLSASSIADGVFYQPENGAPIILNSAHRCIHSWSVLTRDFKDTMAGTTTEKQQELAAKLEPDDTKRQEAMKSDLERLGILCK